MKNGDDEAEAAYIYMQYANCPEREKLACSKISRNMGNVLPVRLCRKAYSGCFWGGLRICIANDAIGLAVVADDDDDDFDDCSKHVCVREKMSRYFIIFFFSMEIQLANVYDCCVAFAVIPGIDDLSKMQSNAK